MTTTFMLVRHATHDDAGQRLTGRSGGAHLSSSGRSEAARLAERLGQEKIAAIHSSPRERAAETAAALAAACAIPRIEIDPELDEVDFGSEWEGKDFATLESDPRWGRWNQQRSLARTPGGERILDVQCRAMSLIERLTYAEDGATVVLVSHAEVIRAVVSYVLGLPIDMWDRFEVAPASVSTIVAGEWRAKLLALNERVH